MRLVWVVIPLILIGIVGMQESFAEDKIIQSPKQQLESGIVPENIQCKENHILALRTNGNHVCITEKTSEKTGWEIIKTFEVKSTVNEESTKIIDEKQLLLEPILEKYGIEWEQYNNVDYSKTIVTDVNFRDVSIMAGIPVAYFASVEFPEFVKVGDEFDVTVKWTFTEYDEEGNIEHQNIPLNNLTKEIFDEALLQVKIPENIEIVTDVSDWGKTVKLYYDTSYNFNNTFTTYVKTIPFDYTDAMHEQTYRFKLTKPFFPPFDYMTLGGLGFGETIHHQDGSLFSTQLDIASINTMQSVITVERLGSVDPQYSEVLPSEVNWQRAWEIVPKAINTPADPDENQTHEIRDFYVNILNRNPTNDELLSAGVSQEWIDSFFEKYPELKNIDDLIPLTIDTETEPIEIIILLDREEVFYGYDGINLVAAFPIGTVMGYDVVNSNNESVWPYHTLRAVHYSHVPIGFDKGTASIGTSQLDPGEYTVVVSTTNSTKTTEFKKSFTILDSKCCSSMDIGAQADVFIPGDEFQIYVKAAPETPLIFNLIEPNGKIIQTKQITTNDKGEIDWQSFTLSRIATPGIWTLEAKSKTNSDTISLLVVSTPDELIKKSHTMEEIQTSYENKLENKKSGYDVLLASSLEPFVDDGRQYIFPKPGHKPAPTMYYNMINYGVINTVGFETNDYGVITYVDESHEKYSIKLHEGFYREDWIPSYIPDGQRLLYAATSYDPTDYGGNLNDQYFASYNFVPTSFVIDENTTSYDLKYNMGFRVNVSYDSQGDEIEDIVEGWSDGHNERVDSYGGVRTTTQNGEMFVLHDGGYYFEHDPNSVTWFIDNHAYIRASSYYYTLDELIPILKSMIDERE